jgi:hypothetical protein
MLLSVVVARWYRLSAVYRFNASAALVGSAKLVILKELSDKLPAGAVMPSSVVVLR